MSACAVRLVVEMTDIQRLASDADRLSEMAGKLASSALALLNNSGASGVRAPNPFGLFPEIHETDAIAGAFSTWFRLWGGIVGAAHSVEAWPEDRSQWPEWTQGLDLIIRPGGLDVALFGCTLPSRAPQALRHGDRIRIRGYPAGVTAPDHYEVRNGIAYMDRPEEMRNGDAPSWIVQFDDGQPLAIGGMSGGVVTIVQGGETPAAVLITQNSRADLDGDGDEDHSSDVTELLDVWQAVRDARLTAKT